MTESKRIALAGASGTGKTTIARFISETYSIPLNPVGSRSVSKAMGFATPYDVDVAGQRREFQHRLQKEKREWEDANESFVTDRTTFDELTYTSIHDIKAVTAEYLKGAIGGLNRYTHIIFFPVHVYCDPGSDPDRVKDLTYHRIFDSILYGFLRHPVWGANEIMTLLSEGIEWRKREVLTYVGLLSKL